MRDGSKRTKNGRTIAGYSLLDCKYVVCAFGTNNTAIFHASECGYRITNSLVFGRVRLNGPQTGSIIGNISVSNSPGRIDTHGSIGFSHIWSNLVKKLLLRDEIIFWMCSIISSTGNEAQKRLNVATLVVDGFKVNTR